MPARKGSDIALIKPGSQKKLYGVLTDFGLTAIEPPLWATVLAGYLRGLGYSVALIDAEAENWSSRETAEQVRDLDPLLAAVMVSGSNPSASTMNMIGASRIVAELRAEAPGVRTLLGGLHPSALPEQTLREEPACDFLCQGEGFYTLPQLLDALKAGAEPGAIPGLWHRDGQGHIVSNERPPLLKDLGSLPMPAWDLLPMDRYRAHNWHCFDNILHRQPYGVLHTSFGCPFKCSFCCINALFGRNTIRYRPVDQVMAELDFLVNTYSIRNFKIIDEMFALNEKRVEELCDAIISRGYDLNFWAYARVNTVTERMLAKMKQAGVNWAAYGFESGSQEVMDDVTKGYAMEHVMDVVEMTYATGMHICGNYIFGLPGDSYETMTRTLALMLEINSEWANIYSAMAFPGSKLYGLALQNGWPLPETWQGYSQYSSDCLPLPTRHLSGGQVLAFRDYAFSVYYKNPHYLEMIRRTFGQATMDHIVAMSEKTLPREHARI